MAKVNIEHYRNDIPKQCWDNVKRRWRSCNELALEGLGSRGKLDPCCLAGSCCLTCKDLQEIAQILTQVGALSEPFYSPVPPVLVDPINYNDVIAGFNSVQLKWRILEGVGVYNTFEDRLCSNYQTFTGYQQNPTNPTITGLIFESSNPRCPDIALITYFDFAEVVGAPDYWYSNTKPVTVCLDWENAYYDDTSGIIVCKRCIDNIPNKCTFARSVIEPLPSTIYYEQSYTYSFNLFVPECCFNDLVSVYLTPNPYIEISPNPQVFPIVLGDNIISFTITALAGSGLEAISAFLLIRAGCASTSISIKSLIDTLP